MDYCAMGWTKEMIYSRAGQLQPTGRPHNSLCTHLRACVYTYIENGGGETELTRRLFFLQTRSYIKCTGE